jgi:hypothetical protein
MVEVKAGALEESFEQFEDDGVAALKAELDVLKAKIATGARYKCVYGAIFAPWN